MQDKISIILIIKNLFDLQLDDLVAKFAPAPMETGQANPNLLHKEAKPIYAEPRHGDIKHSFADINLIKNQLELTPSTNFENKLESIIITNSHLK